MNVIRFITRSLYYYRKQHLAVFLAAIISTCVLTGALIIGDSVNYSLNKLVDTRLGKVEYTLTTGDRFVTNQLSERISDDLNISTASLLLLNTIAINTEGQLRVNKAQLIGIDDDFWTLSDIQMPELSNGEVFISSNLANRLNLDLNDELLLRVRNAEKIPINAPFSSNEDHAIAFRVTITKIINDENLGRFSLRNNQAAPYNIFINKNFLGDKLQLSGLSNTIVTSSDVDINTRTLNESLKRNIKLEDISLQVNKIKGTDEIELISDRIFIDNSISSSISEIEIQHESILTYFVNSLSYNKNETPYSFISAVSNEFLGKQLANNEIIISSWLANDLEAAVGDTIQIKYFVIGPLQSLSEKSDNFIISQITELIDDEYNKSLMPNFSGLSDAASCGEWDTGIPIDLKKIRDKDEEYWNIYKGTPKAFITIEKGLDLWENKFGNYTSFRFHNHDISKEGLEKEILSTFIPSSIGLSFIDVRFNGEQAATNGVDFGELFLSLSFFIIASAIILMILIYSLNLHSRMHEVAVLSSVGISNKKIITLRFYESSVTIFLASIIGGFLSISYNNVMLFGLNSIWNDAIHADMIEVMILPSTILTGIIISIIISLLSIFLVTRNILARNIISAIKHEVIIPTGNGRWLVKLITFLSFLGSISIVVFSILNSVEKNSSLMLMAGFTSLVGCISLTHWWFSSKNQKTNSIIDISTLVIKNASRNKARSIAVVSLLAIGTFTIIVTGANRLTFSGSENQRNSGTGGFELWIENTIPILHNINADFGKEHYGLNNELLLDEVHFIQFHKLIGDDASCLNLNQVQLPQILGINPQIFDSLQAFSFATKLVETNNTWLELANKNWGGLIPAIADQTVIQWGLMKSIGDTITYVNEFGDNINLLLIAGLNPSIFQGNILIYDSIFMANFPGSGGSNIMLADVPKGTTQDISTLLLKYLMDYGIDVNLTSQRLKDFYSVTNTYLTIFMVLGGLGVIIGTFGLGVVVTRNLLERKKEIVVLLALGFRKNQIFNIVVSENILLLSLGIIIGGLSALIGILPSILSPAFHIPENFLFVIISIVALSGVIWIVIPTWISLKRSSFDNLRSE